MLSASIIYDARLERLGRSSLQFFDRRQILDKVKVGAGHCRNSDKGKANKDHKQYRHAAQKHAWQYLGFLLAPNAPTSYCRGIHVYGLKKRRGPGSNSKAAA